MDSRVGAFVVVAGAMLRVVVVSTRVGATSASEFESAIPNMTLPPTTTNIATPAAMNPRFARLFSAVAARGREGTAVEETVFLTGTYGANTGRGVDVGRLEGALPEDRVDPGGRIPMCVTAVTWPALSMTYSWIRCAAAYSTAVLPNPFTAKYASASDDPAGRELLKVTSSERLTGATRAETFAITPGAEMVILPGPEPSRKPRVRR